MHILDVCLGVWDDSVYVLEGGMQQCMFRMVRLEQSVSLEGEMEQC